MKPSLPVFATMMVVFSFPCTSWTQERTNVLNAIYRDESHCLVATEIRGEKDKPFSCYCRDGLVDARYIYQTYLITGRDPNLNGAYLTVQENTSRLCGDSFAGLRAAEGKDWRWNGPEVKRTYPPESEISQLRPDSNGIRTVAYKATLIYRDLDGRITKVENFTAFEREPPTKGVR